MDGQGSAGGAKAFDPLRDWWFEALPALFGAIGEPREPTGEATAGRASQALKLTQQFYDSLFSAYFGALVKQPAGSPLTAFEDLLRGQLGQLAERWDGMAKPLAGPAEIEAALTRLVSGMTDSIAGLLKPLSGNLERTYGGLADAFGLAPVRELGSASRGLALAAVAQRRAQAEYLDIAQEAMRRGVDALIARLAEMSRQGASVDTMLALMRLCVTTMDGAMHEAMQSPRALRAAAELIRAGLQMRQERQRIVAIVSEALNVPTRAEVDEAYREIQELKREVRRLRKSATERPSPEGSPPFVNGHRPASAGNADSDRELQ